MLRSSFIRWLCLLSTAMLLFSVPARAESRLLLGDAAGVVDAWPAVTVWSDPTTMATVDQALAAGARFERPTVPQANFGHRRDALWLRLPIESPGMHRRWVLEVDYAPLNRIDLYLVRQGRVVQHEVLGNAQPFDQRPMRTRAHAVTLELPDDGAPLDVLLRVESTSSMLLPMRFYREDLFLQHEAAGQLLQGLLMGVTLALFLYCVVTGISLRDPLFGWYALMLLGVAVFFTTLTGISQQHLWNDLAGRLALLSPQSVFLAIGAGSLFVCGAMDMPRAHPRQAFGLRLLAVLAMLALGASAIGLLDYSQAQGLATVLGPVPVLLAFRTALVRARSGDPVALMLVLGWGAYAVGVVSMVGLLRGLLPANFWTQHLFQFASLVEMLAWVRVLGLRVAAIQRDAERAALERHALHSLAHTDALTGLPNRRGLNAALQAALPTASADHVLAIYMLDLDGFKPVNDRFGHDAGDDLLVQVGQRLRSLLRHGDLVARLGGDEFVVMSVGLSGEADAQHLGRKLLDAFADPFAVGPHRCRVGLTIGFALAPHDGRDSADLLKRADAAMYAGKQAGRHQIQRGRASTGLAGLGSAS